MELLKNILIYSFLQNKSIEHIALARCLFILYLIDWHSAVKNDKIVTTIKWVFKSNRLSDSGEIEQIVKDDPIFHQDIDPQLPISRKETLSLVSHITKNPCFEDWQKSVIDRVLEISAERSIEELLTFVFSTYPLISAGNEESSDILEKAREYKKLKQQKVQK